MNFFEMLVLVHFVGDWIFQTQKQAELKSKEPNPYLIDHSLFYTAFFVPLLLWKFWYIDFSWQSFCVYLCIISLLFVSHAFLDYRRFEFWLLRKIKGIYLTTDLQPFYKRNNTIKMMDKGLFWIILTTVDQILHIIVLAFIAIILS